MAAPPTGPPRPPRLPPSRLSLGVRVRERLGRASATRRVPRSLATAPRWRSRPRRGSRLAWRPDPADGRVDSEDAAEVGLASDAHRYVGELDALARGLHRH